MNLLSKKEKKILVAVLSILLVLCTMTYLSHKNSQLLISSAEKVEQSEEIKLHIEEVFSVSLEMESGVRGYVITGDESYLEPSDNAMKEVFLHVNHLKNTPGLTEEQKNRIASLEDFIEQKTNITKKIIEVRKQQGMTAAMGLISEGKGKELMNQIRNITRVMLEDEGKRLAVMKEENKGYIEQFAIAFYLLVLKIAATVISVLFLLVFYFRSRNKAEKELKENQELFQNVLDHTSSVISIKDLSGRFILINQEYEKLFKLSKEDVKGKTLSDIFPKDIAEKIRFSDYEVIKQQRQMKFEETMPRTGEMRNYTSLKFPLFDSNHIPYAICSISTDETEKIDIERQHKEQMQRVLDLFNNAPCGYQASNSEGIIIEMNDTLLKWLDYEREEVIGKMPIKNILSEESLELLAYYFPRLKSGEITSVVDVEATYLRKNKTKMPIIANTIATYDENGKFLYTRTSIYNISFKKQVEELVVRN
jgi:PAS domain S-box-containing protein